MLKKILQSKNAKNLFWIAFWGGNILIITALFRILTQIFFFGSINGIFPNVQSKILILLILGGWLFMLILLFLVGIINFLLMLRWLFLKISNRNISQNFKRATISAVFFSVVLFACTFRLVLYNSSPDLSVEEYYKCTTGRIKGVHNDIVITETGVCARESFCRNLSEIANCKNMNGSRGWKVVRGLSKDNFDFEELEFNRDGYGSIEDLNTHWAWILTIKGKTFFWWPYKGNGRFFEIDKETFRYLGEDNYEDKNGLIIKNTRVNK